VRLVMAREMPARIPLNQELLLKALTKKYMDVIMKTPAIGSFSKNPAEVLVIKAGTVARKKAANRPAFLLLNNSFPRRYIGMTAKAPRTAVPTIVTDLRAIYFPLYKWSFT